MAIQLPEFDKLTPEDMGRINLADILYKHAVMQQQLAETAKARAELPWVGPLAKAKALSETSYANFMQPQFLAKIAGSKAFPGFTSGQQTDILNQTAGAAIGGNPMTAFNNVQPDYSQVQESPAMQLFHFMTGNKFRQQQPQQPQQPVAQQVQTPSGMGMPNQEPQAPNMQQPAPTIQPQPSIPAQPNEANMTPTQRIAAHEAEIAGATSYAQENAKLKSQALQNISENIDSGTYSKQSATNLKDAINNPVIQNALIAPLTSGMTLAAIANTGKPAEKEAVGNFTAAANQFITDSLKTIYGNKVAVTEFNYTKDRLKVGNNESLQSAMAKVNNFLKQSEFRMNRDKALRDIGLQNPNLSYPQIQQIYENSLNSDMFSDMLREAKLSNKSNKPTSGSKQGVSMSFSTGNPSEEITVHYERDKNGKLIKVSK